MGRWITLLWTIRDRITLVFRLIKDKRIPLWKKAIPFLPLIYILSPLNLISFSLPIIGQIDDVFLLMMAINLMERTVDDAILDEYRTQ